MINLGELRHPLCFLRGLWWSIRYHAPISGHDFKEVEHAGGGRVLHCTTCGYASVEKDEGE